MTLYRQKKYIFDAADLGLVDALSAPHREILLLSVDHSYEQIAGKLSLNLGTVRSRLNRARAALIAERECAIMELVEIGRRA